MYACSYVPLHAILGQDCSATHMRVATHDYIPDCAARKMNLLRTSTIRGICLPRLALHVHAERCTGSQCDLDPQENPAAIFLTWARAFAYLHNVLVLVPSWQHSLAQQAPVCCGPKFLQCRRSRRTQRSRSPRPPAWHRCRSRGYFLAALHTASSCEPHRPCTSE